MSYSFQFVSVQFEERKKRAEYFDGKKTHSRYIFLDLKFSFLQRFIHWLLLFSLCLISMDTKLISRNFFNCFEWMKENCVNKLEHITIFEYFLCVFHSSLLFFQWNFSWWDDAIFHLACYQCHTFLQVVIVSHCKYAR